MCNSNCCGNEGTCGSNCSMGCFGKCGHWLLKVLLGLLVVATIFCMGFRLGLIVGMVNGGYSHKMMYSTMHDGDMMKAATKVEATKTETKK